VLEYRRNRRGLPLVDLRGGFPDVDDGRGVDRPGNVNLDLTGRTAGDNAARA
jgi:hypothetical protein